jgi:tetratricopeptide (TPR) repeat protein
MADSITALCEIAAEEMLSTPQASTKQLAEKLKAWIERNLELQAALQSDDRLIQINQGNVTAYQILVQGGIANIGMHLHGVDEAKLVEIVREVLRSFQPVGIPQNLPSNGTTTFVGREADMAALHEQLQQSERIAIASIHGMGGIGKTELALQYALCHLTGKVYVGGVCWVRSREEVGTQIVSFARSQLSLQPPEDLELLEQVKWCWRNWQAGEILVVFDDVQQYADVESFLPPAGESRFKVVMTTRLLKVAKSVQNFEIKVLDEASALNLLRVIVSDGRIDQDLETAKRICEWLGYLPLGLELVGQYLEHDPDIDLSSEDEDCPGLWQRLQKARLDAIALKETYSGMTATDGVAAAFELSWNQLNEAEQRLTALLSLFALAEMPWVHVQACLPNFSPEELEVLRNRKLLGLHLLQRTGKGMYQLHQLIREFFAAKREQRSDMEELQWKFYKVMIADAERVRDKPELSLLKESTVTLAHLNAVSELLEMPEQVLDLANCLYWIASLYYSQGRYLEAEPLFVRSLLITEQKLGEDHPDMTTTLHELANLYYSQGRYSESEPLHIKVLSIREKHLGQSHPNVAASLNDLANLYFSQGQCEKAEEHFMKALLIREQQLGENHADVAMTLNNLAVLYESQGRYEEAEPLYVRSLKIWEERLGKQHPDVAMNLNNLAALYYAQGRYEEAEPLYVQSLEIRQKQLGGEHPNVAMSLNNLANLYYSQARYEDAEPLFINSLTIWKQQLGGEHSYVAINLSNLARLYCSQSRHEEAESYFKEALSIFHKQVPSDQRWIARVSSCLAHLYCLQAKYCMAESLYLQALPVLSTTLEATHRWRQEALQNFRSLLQKAIKEKCIDELSDNPMTQSLLQELQDIKN